MPSTQMSPKKRNESFERMKRLGRRKTTDEKVRTLSEYFTNVDGLVRDLKELTPFGAAGI